MKYISPLISDARNKLGGTVWSRNSAGVYQRAHVAPTQPRTTSQQANRALFASLASAWGALSQSQIAAWNQLALTVPWTDTLGHTFYPSGFQLYLSCNRNLQALSLSTINSPPPTKPNLPDLGPVTFSANVTYPPGFEIFATFGPAVNVVPYRFLYRATRPLGAGINFIAPYEYRNMPTYIYQTGNVIELQGPYGVFYGLPAVGSVVGVLIALLDTSTGFRGPWYKGRCVVT